jgi:hypothetical protein
VHAFRSALLLFLDFFSSKLQFANMWRQLRVYEVLPSPSQQATMDEDAPLFAPGKGPAARTKSQLLTGSGVENA